MYIIALPVTIVAGGNHSAVLLQTYNMVGTHGNGGDLPPGSDRLLQFGVSNYYGAVAAQTGGGCSTGSDTYDIVPGRHEATAVGLLTVGRNGAVLQQNRDVIGTGGYRLDTGEFPQILQIQRSVMDNEQGATLGRNDLSGTKGVKADFRLRGFFEVSCALCRSLVRP